MNKKIQFRLWSSVSPALVAALAAAFTVSPAKADFILGPPNPGFESGGQDWNSGASGSGSVNFVNFSNFGTNGPSAPGTNCVMEASDGSGYADLRVNYYSLGQATAGSNSVSVDFDYNILNSFPGGNNVRIDVRFEDSNGNFLGEELFHIGSDNNDTGGTGWHHFHGVAADPTRSAVNMDLRMTMNIFGDDTWSAGGVLFDNFLVKVTPVIGVNNNGNFENFSANWNAGGPGGSAGSENFSNIGTNGPSAPGSNSVMMTADGSVDPPNGNDLRANYFFLGPSSEGTNGVSVDFDYNMLNVIYSGDQIRVGLRFENSSGGFLGENNFHIGTPSNDVGGNGWHHFHGVAVDPTYSAVAADLRLSMNIFGDDDWGSGPVLFDNFVVKATPVVGPNYNGDFENGNANWNSGVNTVPGGFENFYFGPGTNGLSLPGTNCVLMSSDGSLSPPNGNDIRVNSFTMPPNSQTATFSFDYNIVNPISSANAVRVGLRFFSQSGGNDYNGEFDVHPGTPNGDLGAQGWKHYTGVCSVPAGTVSADIRVSMNIFGDDDWNNGPVLFDNFVVITGTNVPPVANNVLMGTVNTLPVTRAAVTNAAIVPASILTYDYLSTNVIVEPDGGIIEPDGILVYPFVTFFTQPAHGTVTAKGAFLTYTANSGYTGNDSFGFAVGDGVGNVVTNTASVLVNGSIGPNQFSKTVNANGNNYTLSFSGAADCDYILELTPSLNPPVFWYPVSTNSANGSGSVTFPNQQTAPAGYWRTQLLP